jgi:hypothetical protein
MRRRSSANCSTDGYRRCGSLRRAIKSASTLDRRYFRCVLAPVLTQCESCRAGVAQHSCDQTRRTRPQPALTYSRDPHRQQFDPWLWLPKSSRQVKSAPAKYLIGVDPMRSCHPRHRRARRHRLFDNPSLLRDAPPLPHSRDRALFVSGNDCYLLGSVHLRSKWTLITGVPLREHGSHVCACPDGRRRTLTMM